MNNKVPTTKFFSDSDDGEEVQDQVESDHEAKLSEDNTTPDKLFENLIKEYLESEEFSAGVRLDCILSHGIYDEADIEDITSEVKVRIYSCTFPADYKVEVKLKTYVSSIVNNQVIDDARKKNAKKRVHVKVNIDDLTVDTIQGEYGSAKRTRTTVELNEFLNSLSEEDKRIMIVWVGCDFNKSETIKAVKEQGIKEKFEAYDLKLWLERMKDNAGWYITF